MSTSSNDDKVRVAAAEPLETGKGITDGGDSGSGSGTTRVGGNDGTNRPPEQPKPKPAET